MFNQTESNCIEPKEEKISFTAGILFIMAGLITMVFTGRMLFQVHSVKSFKYIRTQLIILLIFELSFLLQGIFWIFPKFVCQIQDQQLQYGIGQAALIIMQGIAMMLIIWNMTHMYWILSKQLNFLVKGLDQENEKEFLQGNLQLEMKWYKRLDKFITISIIVLVNMQACTQVLLEDDWNLSSSLIKTITVLNWVAMLMIFLLTISATFILIYSLRTIKQYSKNPKLVNLILTMIGMLIMSQLVVHVLQMVLILEFVKEIKTPKFFIYTYSLYIFELPFLTCFIFLMLYSFDVYTKNVFEEKQVDPATNSIEILPMTQVINNIQADIDFVRDEKEEVVPEKNDINDELLQDVDEDENLTYDERLLQKTMLQNLIDGGFRNWTARRSTKMVTIHEDF